MDEFFNKMMTLSLIQGKSILFFTTEDMSEKKIIAQDILKLYSSLDESFQEKLKFMKEDIEKFLMYSDLLSDICLN